MIRELLTRRLLARRQWKWHLQTVQDGYRADVFVNLSGYSAVASSPGRAIWEAYKRAERMRRKYGNHS